MKVVILKEGRHPLYDRKGGPSKQMVRLGPPDLCTS